MKVLTETHNPAWPTEFSRVKDELFDILRDVKIVSIEHIGSTSIPDLAAKPVLDIDIVVTPDILAATRAALVKAGYEDKGEMGVPGRVAFRKPCIPGSDNTREEMKMNTYVVLDGCLSFRNHRDLKRVLLEDEGLREEYGETKKRLVEKEWIDVDEYCRGKNEILLKILRRAGWSEEDLEEVRKANE